MDTHSRPRRGLLALLAALAAVALGLGAVIVVAGAQPVAQRAREQQPPPSAASELDDPLDPLHAWDRARSRAWAYGDTRALERLYANGSQAGARDVAMLQQYVDRGLVVEGLRVQVRRAEVVRRGADLLVVRLTDRVTGARVVAVGQSHAQGRALPRDGWTRRTVRLERRAGRWVMVAVRR